MTATTLPLTDGKAVELGADWGMIVTISDAGAIDEASVQMDVRSGMDTSRTLIVRFDHGTGLGNVDVAGKVITVALNGADSKDLPAGMWWYDLFAIVDGAHRKLFTGQIQFVAPITEVV
jgi:hypothetical protein